MPTGPFEREPDRKVGLLTADPHPTLLAIAAHSGVDFMILDAEQTSLTVHDCAAAVQQLRGTGVHVSVRVPDLGADTLVAFANTGVQALVLPHLRHVEELEKAAEAVRYAPEGRRSRQVSFASGFGSDFGDPPRLDVLFETVDAVDRAADFAASAAFGGGWLGTTDLFSDLQRTGRADGNALDKAVQHVVDTVRGAGYSIGLPAASAARADEVFARGADRCVIYWERELASLLTAYADSRNA